MWPQPYSTMDDAIEHDLLSLHLPHHPVSKKSKKRGSHTIMVFSFWCEIPVAVWFIVADITLIVTNIPQIRHS